ncbi:MAG: Cupin 2 conserved barrel domain protein [Devosia sp.]|uniref:cupin domain-containing protein n=1 Tax=Devosia sp. TaxID=1871048 RepID=UPI0026149825|nr:cupin domain-containing protein [Devosia sp.]MDB5538533.1 Cupin 2 conserved barrel domain protein [Devosia sp.]
MVTMVTRPLVVRSGEDRAASPLKFLNGRFDCKISAADTDGALCAYDTYRFKPGGPPLHVHFEQDEWFVVLEGEFKFQIGDETRYLKAGDSILGPRRVPHAFRNISETARMLITFQPAGTMEEFFSSGMVDPTSQAFRDLSLAHGMEVVGPPLSI